MRPCDCLIESSIRYQASRSVTAQQAAQRAMAAAKIERINAVQSTQPAIKLTMDFSAFSSAEAPAVTSEP
ncbi:unnamed protein product [Anisakis simplex]|uniref:BON domain-containing protein n=1 Tax=Anisakis simplex TaxID=6269 RepID=A0A0M3JMV6_ANISI|nr:unnamed protein product [Anisakis simplex]